jgi:hypothetical protein
MTNVRKETTLEVVVRELIANDLQILRRELLCLETTRFDCVSKKFSTLLFLLICNYRCRQRSTISCCLMLNALT